MQRLGLSPSVKEGIMITVLALSTKDVAEDKKDENFRGPIAGWRRGVGDGDGDGEQRL